MQLRDRGASGAASFACSEDYCDAQSRDESEAKVARWLRRYRSAEFFRSHLNYARRYLSVSVQDVSKFNSM